MVEIVLDYRVADNYLTWKDVPEGYEIRTLPAGNIGCFPCKMKSLQEANTKMWEEKVRW